MPRRAIRCVVELNLHGVVAYNQFLVTCHCSHYLQQNDIVTVFMQIAQVSAPGCWLPSKEDCYVSLALFSQYKNTQLLSSVFPILVNEKFRFEKTYFTALDEEEVIELLEDELVVIELLQMSEYSDGAVHLATYTNNVRDFLYPFETYRPTVHSRDRDIFLERTVAFPGISPKLEFSSKVVVKESYSDDMDALEDAIDYHKNTLKRLRRSKRRPRSCSPRRKSKIYSKIASSGYGRKTRRNNETIAEQIHRNKIQKTGVDDFDINYDNYQNFTRHSNGTKRLRVDGPQAVDFKDYPTFTKTRPSGYILPHLTGTDDPDASIMSDDDDDEGYSGAGSLIDDMEDTDLKPQNLRRSGKKSARQRTAPGVLRKFRQPATPRLSRSRARVTLGKVQPKQSSSGRKLNTPRQLSQDRKSSTSKQPSTSKGLTTTKQPGKRTIIGTPRKVIGSKLKPGSVRSLSTPRQADRKRPLATIRFPSSQRPDSIEGQPSDTVPLGRTRSPSAERYPRSKSPYARTGHSIEERPITKNGYARNKTPLNRYPRSKYPLAQTKYPSENKKNTHSNDQKPFAMNEYPVEDGPLNITRYPRSMYPLAQTRGPLDTTGYPGEGPYPMNGYPNEAQYPTAGYPNEGQLLQAGYPREGQYPHSGYPSEGQYPIAGHPREQRHQHDGYPRAGEHHQEAYPFEGQDPRARFPSEEPYPRARYQSEGQYPQAGYPSERQYPQDRYLSEGPHPQAGYPNDLQYPLAGYPNEGQYPQTEYPSQGRSFSTNKDPLARTGHPDRDRPLNYDKHSNPDKGQISPGQRASPRRQGNPIQPTGPRRQGSPTRLGSQKRPISPRRQGSPTRLGGQKIPISPTRQVSPTRQIYPSPPSGKRQHPVHINRPDSVHSPVKPTPRQISRQRPLTFTSPGDPSALFYKAPHTQPNRIGQLTSPYQQNGVTRSPRHQDDMGQPGGTATPIFESQYPGVKIRVATTPIGSSAPLPQVINHKYGQNIVSDYAQNPNDPYFISRTPSPTLHQRIEDLTLYHESDVRPPFVVRKLDTDLIGRQPGGVTDQNAKSKPHKCIRLNKFKPGTDYCPLCYDAYTLKCCCICQSYKRHLGRLYWGHDKHYHPAGHICRSYSYQNYMETPTSSRKSPIYGYKKYFDDDEYDDDSEVAELTSRVRDYGVPYRARSVSPRNRQRSLSPSSRLITTPRSRKDLYDSPLNRRLPNVRISREYSPRNTYYGRDVSPHSDKDNDSNKRPLKKSSNKRPNKNDSIKKYPNDKTKSLDDIDGYPISDRYDTDKYENENRRPDTGNDPYSESADDQPSGIKDDDRKGSRSPYYDKKPITYRKKQPNKNGNVKKYPNEKTKSLDDIHGYPVSDRYDTDKYKNKKTDNRRADTGSDLYSESADDQPSGIKDNVRKVPRSPYYDKKPMTYRKKKGTRSPYADVSKDMPAGMGGDIDPHSRRQGAGSPYSYRPTRKSDGTSPYSKRSLGRPYSEQPAEISDETSPYSRRDARGSYLEQPERKSHRTSPYDRSGARSPYSDEPAGITHYDQRRGARSPYSELPSGIRDDTSSTGRKRDAGDPYSDQPVGTRDNIPHYDGRRSARSPYSEQPSDISDDTSPYGRRRGAGSPYSEQPDRLSDDSPPYVQRKGARGPYSEQAATITDNDSPHSRRRGNSLYGKRRQPGRGDSNPYSEQPVDKSDYGRRNRTGSPYSEHLDSIKDEPYGRKGPYTDQVDRISDDMGDPYSAYSKRDGARSPYSDLPGDGTSRICDGPSSRRKGASSPYSDLERDRPAEIGDDIGGSYRRGKGPYCDLINVRPSRIYDGPYNDEVGGSKSTRRDGIITNPYDVSGNRPARLLDDLEDPYSRRVHYGRSLYSDLTGGRPSAADDKYSEGMDYSVRNRDGADYLFSDTDTPSRISRRLDYSSQRKGAVSPVSDLSKDMDRHFRITDDMDDLTDDIDTIDSISGADLDVDKPHGIKDFIDNLDDFGHSDEHSLISGDTDSYTGAKKNIGISSRKKGTKSRSGTKSGLGDVHKKVKTKYKTSAGRSADGTTTSTTKKYIKRIHTFSRTTKGNDRSSKKDTDSPSKSKKFGTRSTRSKTTRGLRSKTTDDPYSRAADDINYKMTSDFRSKTADDLHAKRANAVYSKTTDDIPSFYDRTNRADAYYGTPMTNCKGRSGSPLPSRPVSPVLNRTRFRDRFSEAPFFSTAEKLSERDVERSHRYRYPTHDTLDDLALDTSLAKYRSQVHIDNGHYWTERAAELSGKSHRELFNDNISKIYNRLNRKARTLR